MSNDFTWVKDLKVGDEVAIDYGSFWIGEDYRIFKVEKITPSGRVCLSNGRQYYSDGGTVGDKHNKPLRQVSFEILDSIERKKLLYKINFNEFKQKLSLDQLKTLLAWQEELTKKKGK